MNTVAAGDAARRPHGSVVGAARFAVAAVRSVTWAEFGYFLFISLLVAGMNMAWLVESMLMGKKDGSYVLLGFAMPLLALPFVLGAWAIADRADGSRIKREWRLTLGVVAGAAVAVALGPAVLTVLGLETVVSAMLRPEKGEVIPVWAILGADFLDIVFFTGMGVAVLEMSRRRTRTLLALDAARKEQAQLAREVLESRLAAMQAQVEPHFLFDSLVDIQATYDRHAERGADVMDRLITYLRVALPRLREAGSTVQAEADLLEAYLAVVAARHAGRPVARLAVASDCTQSHFSPMLLLPLIQRAMRGAGRGEVPERVELEVQSAGADLVARLHIEASGQCTEDAELARVRDRLAGLYDGRARLECEEPRPGLTRFTLCVPH